MIICEVIGNVWATKKEPLLEGFKLMVVKEKTSSSMTLVAVDIVGAGIGEQVLVVKGSTARRAAGEDSLPIDAAIVGIIDAVEMQSTINPDVGTPDAVLLTSKLDPKRINSRAKLKEENE